MRRASRRRKYRRENRKGDFFRQRPVDQFDKGLAAGAGQPLPKRLVAQAQAAKRAAEMEVGGVKKGEVHGGRKAIRLAKSRPGGAGGEGFWQSA